MIMCRLTPVLVFKSINPISMLPAQIKLYLTLIFSFVILVATKNDIEIRNFSFNTYEEFFFSLSVEFLIGLTFWFALLTVYAAVYTMLKALDMQVGFNPMGIFNPSMNDSDPILTRVIIILLSLLFFILDGHYKILTLVTETVRLIPLNSGYGEIKLSTLSQLLSSQYILAVVLVLPIIIAIFWIDLILGLCNKMMPQINIYFVGLPLKIAIAMIALSFSAGHIISIGESMLLKVEHFWNSLY
nr:flagellar biosynthetic protein FliR [Motilimonas cestriensis]